VLVGQFVAASSYLRAPTVIVGGSVTHALVTLSAAFGRGDHEEFVRVRRAVTRTVTTVIGLFALGLLLLSDVLLDTYYPGWKATVDGKSAHIEAADAAFRSVAVAAGRHTVRFSYGPASVRWGGIVSLLGLGAILICIGFRRSEERADAAE